MNFVVVGCGRVGISLSMSLQNLGHHVTVIDDNENSLKMLPQTFEGKSIKGFGFDQNTLIKAGIQNAFALAAVTDNDNTNILSCRLARESFRVQKTVARVYNSTRAEFFERLGIPTVATVKWTTNQVLRQMIPIGSTNLYQDPLGNISLIEVDYDESWVSQTVKTIEELTESKVAFIGRYNKSFLPKDNDVMQLNDQLHMLVDNSLADKVSHILGKRFELSQNEGNR